MTTNGTNLVVCGNGTVEFDPSVLPEAEEMYNTTRHIGLHGGLHMTGQLGFGTCVTCGVAALIPRCHPWSLT